MGAAAAGRVRREQCARTKHDAIFSSWKILVGPYDWEGHSAGKEGVHRYRIHNLPDKNAPGLYELGIKRCSVEEGRKYRSSDSVIVVYIGQAENVKARLQQYGRSGSHLGTGVRRGLADIIQNGGFDTAGTMLFKDVFSRGFSVVFRWAPMSSKAEAERAEAQLLNYFDYAWNKIKNNVCRHEEILSKLEKKVSLSSSILEKVKNWKYTLAWRKPGIKINRTRAPSPQVRKIVSYKPHLVQQEQPKGAIRSQGNAQKVNSSPGRNSEAAPKSNALEMWMNFQTCGAVLEDGSCCLEQPIQGRKRCQLHKGRRIVSAPTTQYWDIGALSQI